MCLKNYFDGHYCYFTQEESHSGGTAVEIYTTVTLLSTVMFKTVTIATSVTSCGSDSHCDSSVLNCAVTAVA